MVTRASSVPHLNSSGGSSNESGVGTGSGSGSSGRRSRVPNTRTRRSGKSVTPTQARNTGGISRSRSLTNGMQRASPQKATSSSGGVTSRNTPVFLRSRENEIGSADTLEVVASKSTGSEPSTPEDNINVVVRVRPLNEKEKRDRRGMILQFPGNGQIIIESSEGTNKRSRNQENVHVFTYNVVFEPGATQEDILDYSGIKRIIEMAIEGFSCTAFCYGQTGSGKTHTLTGPPDLFIGKPNPNDARHGLIFRSFLYLFRLIKSRKNINYVLKASFLEIYNERVIDLLNPGSARKPLAVRWSKKSGGFFVENLFTVDCEELDDLLAVLEEEQQTDGGVFISKRGKINFVDLAGSELTKKTLSEGKTLEEANNINKSLMVLGYCIASLSDSKKRYGHIPYRDSQLTKLLADSLAGNGVTLMIACVSPSQYNHAETLNTLRYASRAKRIRTKPVIMMDPREALILSLKRDINALEMENDHLKATLNLHHETFPSPNDAAPNGELLEMHLERVATGGVAVPKIELERLAELDGNELAELVKLYMQENEALRQENNHLFTVRETILRDQEIVCRENERLLKKLEDVNKWLVSQGKVDKAISILKRLEKVNKKHVPTGTYQIFSASCLKIKQEENKNNNYSIIDLFKTPRLRRTTLLLIVIWMAISLVFDGHVRNVSSLGVNVFITFTVACFTEFPADTILTLILDKWGRRWLACGSMIASGIFSLLATLSPPGLYFAALAIMGRFFVNISYNIGLQYAAEILPTVVRAQGVAFIHIMGYVASIIAPFVVYLEKVSPVLPLIILGVLGIVGGLLALLLPETLNHDLPQTLTDGEEFGRGQSIWDFPCLTKRVDESSDLEVRPSNFVRSTQTGASLRSSTRAELRSSILRRSVNSRYSSKL